MDLLNISTVNQQWSLLANDDENWYYKCCHITGLELRKQSTFKNWKNTYFNFVQAIKTFNSQENLDIIQIISDHTDTHEEDSLRIAKFLLHCSHISSESKSKFLSTNTRVLFSFVSLISPHFSGLSLPEALRQFSLQIELTSLTSNALYEAIELFAEHFIHVCNPDLPHDMIYPLAYSLLLLDIDLKSFQIKKKMSKREFIRNSRGIRSISMENYVLGEEYLGTLYDFVLLRGLKSVPIESGNEIMKFQAIMSNVKGETKLIVVPQQN